MTVKPINSEFVEMMNFIQQRHLESMPSRSEMQKKILELVVGPPEPTPRVIYDPSMAGPNKYRFAPLQTRKERFTEWIKDHPSFVKANVAAVGILATGLFAYLYRR